MRLMFTLALLALATAQSSTDPSTTSTSAKPDTTTAPPSPKTTTAPPAPKTTTAPPAPKTTTAPPAPKTTTAPPAPKTTTVAPLTTPTPPKTTTSMPIPSERTSPPTVEYHLSEYLKKDNKTINCIMVKMAAQLSITYTNTRNVSETAYVNLMNTTTVDQTSKCDANTSILVLNINGDVKNQITFVGAKESKKQFVKTLNLAYTVDENEFPLHPAGDVISASVTNLTMFKTSFLKSYLCVSAEEQKLDDEVYKVILKVTDVQFDIFRETDNKVFNDAIVCMADDQVSDIVPIAVGIALASLVVIVLVAYFIGRRRSRRLAYQSV